MALALLEHPGQRCRGHTPKPPGWPLRPGTWGRLSWEDLLAPLALGSVLSHAEPCRPQRPVQRSEAPIRAAEGPRCFPRTRDGGRPLWENPEPVKAWFPQGFLLRLRPAQGGLTEGRAGLRWAAHSPGGQRVGPTPLKFQGAP